MIEGEKMDKQPNKIHCTICGKAVVGTVEGKTTLICPTCKSQLAITGEDGEITVKAQVKKTA